MPVSRGMPRNWFQFADDAAAVTSSEYENQILLNVFTRWCNWSGMAIRVDKCKTFGIKKTVTRSVQFKPKLFLVREQVPTVDMDKSFKYLGHWYNFEMDNAEHKANIMQLTNDILMKIDSLRYIQGIRYYCIRDTYTPNSLET